MAHLEHYLLEFGEPLFPIFLKLRCGYSLLNCSSADAVYNRHQVLWRGVVLVFNKLAEAAFHYLGGGGLAGD